jgi:hypothetical protein
MKPSQPKSHSPPAKTPKVTTDNDSTTASRKLQTNLLAIQNWLKMWRIKANGYKSTQVTFTTRKDTKSNHRQRFDHSITQATNQPTLNSKLAQNVEN